MPIAVYLVPGDARHTGSPKAGTWSAPGVHDAVVLAAGASSRLGTPKALVDAGGEPAIVRIVRLLRDSDAREIVVVTGAERERIERVLLGDVRLVHNVGWANGRTGSLKAAIQTLKPGAGVLVWPVDHPAVDAETVRALLRKKGAIRVPVQAGRRGHPTYFSASLKGEILDLKDDEPLHRVLHAKPARVVEVPVADAGIHFNLDTPVDIERLDAYFRRPPAHPMRRGHTAEDPPRAGESL